MILEMIIVVYFMCFYICHYCVNTTDVYGGGFCVAADDTVVSTLLACVVVGYVWQQMTLLCQHH